MVNSFASKKLFTNLPYSYVKQSMQAPHTSSETEVGEVRGYCHYHLLRACSFHGLAIFNVTSQVKCRHPCLQRAREERKEA